MKMHANPVGITKDIYKITNNINGKIYIGQAKNTKERFRKHCYYKDCLIDLAIKKYGKENFSVEIIESQIENYNEKEKYWIAYFDCKVPNGYNICDGGEEPPTFYGIECPIASIKDEATLLAIKEDLRNTKKPLSQIAEQYNTNKRTVLRINQGLSYINTEDTYPLRKVPNINGKLTEEDIDNIIEELKCSYDSNTNIGKKYGVKEHTIRNINAGRSHFREGLSYPIRPVDAVRSKVTYLQLMEIAELLQHSSISINQIAKKYNLDWNTVNNINKGTGLYFRRELKYPLRLPPHKKK